MAKTLGNVGSLPAKYKPHKLKGKYSGYWECPIESDWLLAWGKIYCLGI
ncbi:MAG: type II toxin-antitoxin system YafQ family toxin [Prevotella sp.]|nr:type II toxin-antitoxin system YafQ family toxin [Prevotella sp.]